MTHLYEITDYHAPIDSSNRTRTASLTVEQIKAMNEYNHQAVEVYGIGRYVIKGSK